MWYACACWSRLVLLVGSRVFVCVSCAVQVMRQMMAYMDANNDGSVSLRSRTIHANDPERSRTHTISPLLPVKRLSGVWDSVCPTYWQASYCAGMCAGVCVCVCRSTTTSLSSVCSLLRDTWRSSAPSTHTRTHTHIHTHRTSCTGARRV